MQLHATHNYIIRKDGILESEANERKFKVLKKLMEGMKKATTLELGVAGCLSPSHS